MNKVFSKCGILENKYLLGAFLLGTMLQIGVVVIPPLAQIFDVVPLNGIQWFYTIGISLLPVPIIELQKKWNEIKFGKIVYTMSHSSQS